MAWASYPYEGQVVLITGAGSGIGQAIARAFLSQGASVVLTGRRVEPLEETAAGFDSERFLTLAGDMSSVEDIERIVAETKARWGRIDVVVANAGLSLPGTIDKLDEASWERMRSINLDGLIRLSRAVVPHLRETRGNIVAISSASGFGGDWNQAGYNATKGAVHALVQSMALDLGRDGVRVNVVAPGFTETKQTVSRLKEEVFWGVLRDRLGLDRAAQPEDIANAILFIASPDAGYMTGALVPVDGGLTASVGAPRPPYEITDY